MTGTAARATLLRAQGLRRAQLGRELTVGEQAFVSWASANQTHELEICPACGKRAHTSWETAARHAASLAVRAREIEKSARVQIYVCRDHGQFIHVGHKARGEGTYRVPVVWPPTATVVQRAEALLTTAREAVKAMREGRELTDRQRAVQAWAAEWPLVEDQVPLCGCGVSAHTSHLGAAQHAAHIIFSATHTGGSLRFQIYACRRDNGRQRVLHVGK